jgi:chromosomal replication initiator protein
LTVPDYDTRVKILEHKIRKDGFNVTPDIVHYIATNVQNNVRELESALISLLALSTLNKSDINLKTAEKIIDRLVKRPNKEITLEFIKETVCNYFNLPISSLSTKSRKREIVLARQLAMYFAKKLTYSSSSVIGACIGDKDHATVLYACNIINNLIDTDKDFKNRVIEVEAKWMK